MNIQIRCSACARLLFKVSGDSLGCTIAIKCPRCRQFNHLRPAQSPFTQRPERDEKGNPDGTEPGSPD